MKYYCEKCQKEMETRVQQVNQDFQVKDQKVNSTIRVRICEVCGEEVWDEIIERENEKSVFSAYRKKVGLLQPEEILEIRNKYKVSQSTFAKILGFGAKTITRYENGSIQDFCHDNLIRLVGGNAINFYALWMRRKVFLTHNENSQIEKLFYNDFPIGNIKTDYCTESSYFQTIGVEFKEKEEGEIIDAA